jgi:hypothetical protein
MNVQARYFASPLARLAAALGIMGLVAAGCQSAPAVTPAVSSSPSQTRTILVWPIADMAAIYGEQTGGKCPLSGKVFKTAEVVPADTQKRLTRHLIESLEAVPGLTVLPPGQARGAVSGLITDSPQGLPPRLEMIEAARSTGADAVLATNIYRFRQRIGEAYGVDRPASVAMGLFLIESPSGKRAWNAHFDETQRTLFEDLFRLDSFVKRKGVWVTADEMAAGAIADMVARFPAP